MTSILQARLVAEELKAILGRSEGAARLRPFARQVGKAAVSLPHNTWETLGNLRAALRKG